MLMHFDISAVAHPIPLSDGQLIRPCHTDHKSTEDTKTTAPKSDNKKEKYELWFVYISESSRPACIWACASARVSVRCTEQLALM